MLNKRYKEDDVEDVIPTYEDIVADVDSNDEVNDLYFGRRGIAPTWNCNRIF